MTGDTPDMSLHIDRFMQQRRLPEAFRNTIADHYLPLANWLRSRTTEHTPFLLGIGGAQGTGKSTLASFLQLVVEEKSALRVATLSLDDFYFTKEERRKLGEQVHSLLDVRGVPGTHDLPMLFDYLQQLRQLPEGEALTLPRFDKSCDDRAAISDWTKIVGPVDIVILEGWCVGSSAQSKEDLSSPVNVLEAEHDRAGVWRNYVNRQLEGPYALLFQSLDALVFLQVPDFEAVFRWRYKQEMQLAGSADAKSTNVMDKAAVHHFVQYFERLSKAALDVVPPIADVNLILDSEHRCTKSIYQDY